MTTANTVASERQLDWLLGEVLGGAAPSAAWPTTRARGGAARPTWLAAALVILAVGTALGVAWLRRQEAPRQATQEPPAPITWHEAHGPGSVDAIPADAVNLHCFDFDDASLAQLTHFTKLERLDLSGMDVNDRGYAVSLPISDAGVAHLVGLPNLRWLSLAGCHNVKGTSFGVLEAMPRLEHLDLTYSGIMSPAVERLANLVSLRELSLSSCMDFDGRSLAEVAKLPGLCRLELRACVTLSAADVVPLAQLSELRHLDLRDCQGRFRGQTERGFSTGGEEPSPPPVQDGIGITDATVAALANLQLETLLLGGSESLTDGIGTTLTKMTTLRELDLSNLPKVTGALLAQVPAGLVSLSLDHNRQFTHQALQRLPKLANLRELGLAGLPALGDDQVVAMLEGRSLHSLRLGAADLTALSGPQPEWLTILTSTAATAVATQRELRRLAFTYEPYVDPDFLAALRGLPELNELDLTASAVGTAAQLAPLAACPALRRLKLTWCKDLDLAGLQALTRLPLQELDLYGTNLKAADIHEVAKAWPGCLVKLPKGQLYRVP